MCNRMAMTDLLHPPTFSLLFPILTNALSSEAPLFSFHFCVVSPKKKKKERRDWRKKEVNWESAQQVRPKGGAHC